MEKRYAVRALVPAVLVTLALTGCSSSDSGSDGATDTGKASRKTAGGDGTGTTGATAGKPVTRGGTLGGAGSACPMPVTFDYATSWKPEAVEVDPGSELAALGEQGPVRMVCEIDAKPAGNIGYLRVWAGDPSGSGPRAVLEAFLADDPNAGKAAYTEVEAGSSAAAEVTYTVTSELLDEPKTERAFAVATPDGPVVVHLGGLDSGEHQEMLPAYELAKKTLKLG
ncbi:lipoprotein [Streptomyces sp. NPDC058620]|uniref:lipoprotein n=1 Tax=Streptomyces sp. NPDC058620 TaxID=3346560 RepID=UPI0036518B71